MPDLSARSFTIFGFLVLAVLLAGLGLWAVTAQIAGAVVAQGMLRPAHALHVLRHPDGGVVEWIGVEEGDKVHAGDRLLTLDATRHLSRRAVLETQLAELLARIARLKAERDGAADITFPVRIHETVRTHPNLADVMQGQIRLFQSRRELAATRAAQLDKRASQIGQQKSGLTAQATALARQLDLLREDLNRQRDLLMQGLAQYPRIAALEREEAVLTGRLAELYASMAEAELRLTETQLQQSSLEAEQREQVIAELRDLQSKSAELSETLQGIDYDIRQLTLRAPVSGRVHQLTIHTPQSVLKPGQPVLDIVPQDGPLRVAARIQPRDIDQLFIGQPVTLTFPSVAQRHGADVNAHIDKISADAVTGDQTGHSYFEVEITIDPKEHAHLPPEVVLVPGMPVTAFIKTGYRSPISYLLHPLSGFFRTAMREK